MAMLMDRFKGFIVPVSESLQIERAAFSAGAVTDRGRVRERNEDRYYISEDIGLFVVADGMGGHRGGEMAAAIVKDDLPVLIETGLDKLASSSPASVRKLLRGSLRQQSRQLYMEGCSEAGCRYMGSTVALVLVHQGRAYAGNLGDSRIYRFRKGRLTRLSRDHSVISELIEKELIHPSQAEGHPCSGQITQFAGMEAEAEPYLRSFRIQGGDQILLCTDGLTDMVDEQSIESVLNKDESPLSRCEELVNAANSAGSYDNITTVLVSLK